MTEPEDYTEPTEVTRVARDLTAILDLSADLDDQAANKANDPEFLPGGDAMVALAPVASPQAWEFRYEAAEHNGRNVTHVVDEDEDWEPPLQTILFWSEQWRVEKNLESDRRPTIASEVGFLRQVLNWAYETEPHFEDFARDVNRARVRLENVLYAGKRVERTRVPCNSKRCETNPCLIKLYGKVAVEDRYKCPACKTKYDQGDYEDAYAEQLRSEGAAKFLPLIDAIGTLRRFGRPEPTIRRWLAPNNLRLGIRCPDCERRWAASSQRKRCPDCGTALERMLGTNVVEGYCDLTTRRPMVWWPTMWALHNKKRPKQQRSSTAA